MENDPFDPTTTGVSAAPLYEGRTPLRPTIQRTEMVTPLDAGVDGKDQDRTPRASNAKRFPVSEPLIERPRSVSDTGLPPRPRPAHWQQYTRRQPASGRSLGQISQEPVQDPEQTSDRAVLRLRGLINESMTTLQERMMEELNAIQQLDKRSPATNQPLTPGEHPSASPSRQFPHSALLSARRRKLRSYFFNDDPPTRQMDQHLRLDSSGPASETTFDRPILPSPSREVPDTLSPVRRSSHTTPAISTRAFIDGSDPSLSIEDLQSYFEDAAPRLGMTALQMAIRYVHAYKLKLGHALVEVTFY